MTDQSTAPVAEKQLDITEIDNIQAEAFAAELAQMDAENEPDYDPEAAQQQAQAEKQQEEDIEAGAAVAAWAGVAAIEGAIQTFVHHRFQFSESDKAYAIENMGPLIAKYGDTVPLWLAKYKEEIGGLKAVAVLGKGTVVGLKTLAEEDRKAAEEAAQAEQKEAGQDAGTHQSQ